MNLQRLDDPQEQLSTAPRLEASRIDSFATLLSRAFHNEPDLVYMVQDEEARRTVSLSFFQAAIQAGLVFGEILTTDNADGVAVWISPDHDLPFRRTLRIGVIEFPSNLGCESATRYMTLRASVEEVRKRLDNSRRQHTFIVSGLEWQVNAEQISVSSANKRD